MRVFENGVARTRLAYLRFASCAVSVLLWVRSSSNEMLEGRKAGVPHVVKLSLLHVLVVHTVLCWTTSAAMALVTTGYSAWTTTYEHTKCA